MTSENKQRLCLIFIMTLVAFGVGALALYVLYDAAFEEKKVGLLNIAKVRARTIESVARFDKEKNVNFPGGHVEATLSQFREAHEKYENLEQLGDYNLFKLEGDQIVFLLTHHHSPIPPPSRVSLKSKFVEPMKRALAGESGVFMGLDSTGEVILAAYEPVNILNLGLVVKVNLSDIREPFIYAGFIAGAGGLIIIFFGGIVFFKFSEPLIRSIRILQEKYEIAVKGSKNGLWDRPDVTRDEEWWSDEWYAMLGYQNTEIAPSFSNFKKLVHPDDLFRVEKLLKDHCEDGMVFDVEYRLKTQKGSYRWFRSRGTAKSDKVKKTLRMSGSITDIHEQKLDREKIEKLSQIVEQSPFAILITDKDGHIEYVNKALTDFSGYTLDDLRGKTPRVFKSGKSDATYYEGMWKSILKGNDWRGVFHNKKKNGELYWESVLISSLKDVNGNIVNLIGLKEDISEKKQLESTLIDHERLIRSVINNLNDGLVIVNAAGNIQLFNKGAERIFGYPAEEIMDKPVYNLIDKTDREKYVSEINSYIETHSLSNNNSLIEISGSRKDGSTVALELTITQMKQRGEFLLIGLVRDISERKEIEEKLRFAQDQVMISQKLAGVGELAAGVSHEVLNPVNIISVHTQILQKKTKDSSVIQEYCAKIKHEVNRITKIMGSLLIFSRDGDSEFIEKEIIEDIDNVLALVEEDFKLSNIKIVKGYSDVSTKVLLDSDKMRQVFLNLMNNAKHAMPQGGTLSIHCFQSINLGRTCLVIKVSDTGVGMSEAVKLKMFNPFFTTKPEGVGTGVKGGIKVYQRGGVKVYHSGLKYRLFRS